MENEEGDSGVRFHAIDNVEGFWRYSKGGYHPVGIGDRLKARYRVLDKLGHGGYSTVWLARDETLQRLVAVKVCTADASPREVEILNFLGNSPPPAGFASLGRDMMPCLLDNFFIDGPHGTHTCIVTALARCTLDQAREASWGQPFRLDVARSLAAQLAIAVAYLHEKGIVHGDLHLGNVFLKASPDLHLLSDEEVHQKWGEPELEPVTTFDNKPIPPNVPLHAVYPLWLAMESHKVMLVESRIVLRDFGEAFFPSQEQRLISRTPLHSRPPEDRFEPEKPRSFPSDIWTLGCSIWAILGQKRLFDSFIPRPDSITSLHVQTLGKLPPHWWVQWDGRLERFTEDGQLRDEGVVHTMDYQCEDSIQQPRREEGMEPLALKETEAFVAMILQMLVYEPEKRGTIQDVLRSEWMTGWAIPSYERMRGQLQEASHGPKDMP